MKIGKNSLLQKAIQTQINLYKLIQPKNDFLFYVYNHPEAPYKEAYLNHEKVLLQSGGMDSYMGYFIAKKHYKNVKGIYVNYGYPYAEMEMAAIKRLGIECEIKDMSELRKYQQEGEKYWGEIFPGRNWILAIIAAGLIQQRGEVWTMAVNGEIKKKWGDKSELMLEKGSRLLTEFYRKDIEITTPYAHLTKGQLVMAFLQEGGDVEMVKKTVSCHYINSLEDLPCGKCMGCLHRFVAMQVNGIEEIYKIPKDQVITNAKGLYQKEVESPISSFSEARKKEISAALGL